MLLNNHVLVHHSNDDELNIHNIQKKLEEFETNDIMDVDKTVKKYMLKYGINKVRGGSYKNEVLEDWQIKSLEHELKLLKPNNDINDENKLDEFINNHNKSNIDDTINHIILFRKRILKLKDIDKLTDIDININNIIIAFNKYDERTKLITEFEKYNNQPLQRKDNEYLDGKSRDNEYLDGQSRDKLIKMDRKIKELSCDINKLYERQQIFNIRNIIDIAYGHYLSFIDNSNSADNDYIVRLYSIKIFNTEIKQQIKDFKTPFGSTEEELLEIHRALLKRKLELIQIN